jgi:hypothetical protein
VDAVSIVAGSVTPEGWVETEGRTDMLGRLVGEALSDGLVLGADEGSPVGLVLGADEAGSVGFKLTEGVRDKVGKELGCELTLGATLVVGICDGWEETLGADVGGGSVMTLAKSSFNFGANSPPWYWRLYNSSPSPFN